MDLKTFSHSDESRKEKVDVHEVIQSAVNIVWNEIKYKAELVKEYSDLPYIFCYPQQLSQVFLNLLMNASQSITEKGKITIRTMSDGDMVVVEIEDTGCGMSDNVQKHLFEPFFTTKPVGKGTGLGLSLVYNIIEKHNGTISIVSAEGKGTKVTVSLPEGDFFKDA